MSILKKLFYISLILSITIFQACDRLNMYDIASGKSKTAYAIAYDGANYTLILANVYYVKTFKLNPALTNIPSTISVNQKGEILIFDASSTILINSDLSTWTTVAPVPASNNILGFNDSFIYFDLTSFYIVQLFDNYVWTQTIGSFPPNSLGIFKGHNSEIFIVEPNVTDVNFYSMNNPLTPLFTAAIAVTLTNPFGGYTTNNYFYIWYNDNLNSIFRITPTTSSSLNFSMPIGDSLVDVTVTDNDKVFAIVIEAGQIYLKQIIYDNNYPVVLFLGSGGTFFIE